MTRARVVGEQDDDAFTPAQVAEMLRDLDLSDEKPLGYLPVDTLRKCGLEPFEVAARLFGLGYVVALLPTEVCMVGNEGALYACHPEALQRLIDRHSEIVEAHGWPRWSAQFLMQVATDHVTDERDHPDLYRVIGLAFNDPRFREPRHGL